MTPDLEEYARMARAREMGFNVDAPQQYHQTKGNIEQFKLNADPSSHSGGGGIWVRDDPRYSLSAHQTGRLGENVEGVNEMPVVFKDANPLPVREWSQMKYEGKLNSQFPQVVTEAENRMLRNMGYSHASVGSETVVFDPSTIRSRFAAFDPARAGSSNILASNAALPLAGLYAASQLYGQTEKERERVARETLAKGGT